MIITKELIGKARSAQSAEELLQMAKAENAELTEMQAAEYFEELHRFGELADDELCNVSGGYRTGEPKFQYNDVVRVFAVNRFVQGQIVDRSLYSASGWKYLVYMEECDAFRTFPENEIALWD